MSTIYLRGQEASAVEAALHKDVSDPVGAMRSAGVDVSTFFEYGTWHGVDFSSSDLTGVSFKGADLTGAIFSESQLEEILKTDPRYLPTPQAKDDGAGDKEAASFHEDKVSLSDGGEELPHNIEAEQRLLGSLLSNNEIYDSIASKLNASHFYDPVHARVFELIASRIQKNMIASPTALKNFLIDDPGLKDLGGVSYLAKLPEVAVNAQVAKDYAQAVYDLAVRRELIRHAEQVKTMARTVLEGQDAHEQIVAAEQQLYQLGESGGRDGGYSSFISAATDAVNQVNAAYQSDSGLVGLDTGLVTLDQKIGGMIKGDLIVLAGRPSMGRAALASGIAFHTAKHYKRGTLSDGREGAISGGVVGYCSLETSAGQLANRLLGSEAGVNSAQLVRGGLSEAEFRRYVEVAKSLETLPLNIDDSTEPTIAEVVARARRLKRMHSLDLLIVDSIQRVRMNDDSDVESQRDLGRIVRGLKQLAVELDIPVLALSELSNDVDDRADGRPHLGDLREFGSVERYADVVLLLTRPEYYHERTKPLEESEDIIQWRETMERLYGRAEVIVAKNAHGPIGTVELAFEGRALRFSDLSKP